MEFTAVFRNMMPLEALITTVKDLIDDRGLTLASAGKLQVSFRKIDSARGAHYDIRLSSESARQSWAALDDSPERALRTVFEHCDQAIAAARAALGAASFTQGGRLAGLSKLASMSH